jgi:trk system potassium uptake protein TrkH
VQDGGIIVVFAWLLTVLFSSIPFVLYQMLNPLQALFETVSGWTTTGLSVVDVEAVPRIFLFWRSLMQFFGGAGLAVIMLSAIIGPSSSGLYGAEGRTDQLLPNIRRSAKIIMTIYSGYIIAGIFLYMWAGMNFFDAINHSIAALSTGGFSTRAESIAYWPSIRVGMVTIVLMLLGTINFALHYLLLRGKIRHFFRNGEIKVLGFCLAVATPLVVYFGILPLYSNISEAWRVSFFQVASAISTTGFSTVGFVPWNDFAIMIIVLLMLIGGGVNSTAGGIKQYRVYVMLKSLWWDIRSFLLPQSAVSQNYIYRGDRKDYLDKQHINQVGNYIFLYLCTYFIGVAVYLAHGFSLTESMFEFASALGTVGLSIGVTSATNPPAILWTGIIGMTLRRLEFIVIFYTILSLIRDGHKFTHRNTHLKARAR